VVGDDGLSIPLEKLFPYPSVAKVTVTAN